MDAVERLIWEIGGNVTQKCYSHLIASVRYSLDLDEFPRGVLTKQFYPAVAEYMGLSGHNPGVTLSRAVARAAADTWDHGNKKRLQEIAGREWTGKPTPGELIYFLRKELLGQREAETV